jgi:hypothetical protein
LVDVIIFQAPYLVGRRSRWPCCGGEYGGLRTGRSVRQPSRGRSGSAQRPAGGRNTSEFTPTPTDRGNLGSLKYSFSEAHTRRTQAGWAREVTVRQLPIAKSIAGVNMRLDAGGIRELHWHLPAEWAYMQYGKARITAVDANNRKLLQT